MMQPGIFFKYAMNKILPILIFAVVPLSLFSQPCNEKDAVKNFTEAQEADDAELPYCMRRLPKDSSAADIMRII